MSGARASAGVSRTPGSPTTKPTHRPTKTYTIRATTLVTIPAGTYTVGVNSADGFQLTIPGIVFTGRFENDEMHRVVVRAMAAALGGDLQGILRENEQVDVRHGPFVDFIEPTKKRRTFEDDKS